MSADSFSKRADVAQLNADALIALMASHNITFPARDFTSWRPTCRVSGTLRGFGDESYTILCTNGIVAYFERANGDLFYGHVSNFDGDIKPLHSIDPEPKARDTKESKPRTPRAPKPSAVELAMELLRTLQAAPAVESSEQEKTNKRHVPVPLVSTPRYCAVCGTSIDNKDYHL